MSIADIRGTPTSSDNPTSLELFEASLNEALALRGDPLATIDRALAETPSFVMGHCLRSQLQLLSMERATLGDAARSIELAETFAGQANDRERGHIAAARAWLGGDLEGAVEHWEAVLIDYPRDLLALMSAHMTDFYLGDSVQLRDRAARVLRSWDEVTPGYGYVLGLYSFGLEESGDYGKSEEVGRHAVEINPNDVYAIHAVAHVMEMQSRQRDGIEWMTSRQPDWVPANGFRIHLWWHLALYHLDLGEVARVLDIYDDGMRNKNSEISLEELDAVALLWRLTLLGVEVGDRWNDLADKWQPHAEDTLYAFNDMHAMMAFAASGREMAAAELLGSAASYVTERGGTNAKMTREIGLPVCRAILAFSRGDYETTVDLLQPVRSKTFVFGGSYAQRDVIALTLIEAAIRCKRYNLSHALLAERLALKPTSVHAWRSLARVLDGMNDIGGAQSARSKAEEVLAQ